MWALGPSPLLLLEVLAAVVHSPIGTRIQLGIGDWAQVLPPLIVSLSLGSSKRYNFGCQSGQVGRRLRRTAWLGRSGGGLVARAPASTLLGRVIRSSFSSVGSRIHMVQVLVERLLVLLTVTLLLRSGPPRHRMRSAP